MALMPRDKSRVSVCVGKMGAAYTMPFQYVYGRMMRRPWSYVYSQTTLDASGRFPDASGPF